MVALFDRAVASAKNARKINGDVQVSFYEDGTRALRNMMSFVESDRAHITSGT